MIFRELATIADRTFTRWSAVGAFVLLLSGCLEVENSHQFEVISVNDGDTITVLDSAKQQHKIRLAGIDAPEKTQAFGQKSKESLSTMISGHKVDVVLGKTDRYGRNISKVVSDGVDVNLEQIKAGLAWHYKQYENDQPTEDRTSYAKAETDAAENKLGLWIDADPTPPWEFRKEEKSQR